MLLLLAERRGRVFCLCVVGTHEPARPQTQLGFDYLFPRGKAQRHNACRNVHGLHLFLLLFAQRDCVSAKGEIGLHLLFASSTLQGSACTCKPSDEQRNSKTQSTCASSTLPVAAHSLSVIVWVSRYRRISIHITVSPKEDKQRGGGKTAPWSVGWFACKPWLLWASAQAGKPILHKVTSCI